MSNSDTPDGKRLAALLNRLDKNLADEQKRVMGLDKKQIYEIAGVVSATVDAHYYMTAHHTFSASEVDYLLKFDNPLEVVADEVGIRRDDISDIAFALRRVCGQQEALRSGHYELEGEKPPGEKPSILTLLKDGAEKAARQEKPEDKDKGHDKPKGPSL